MTPATFDTRSLTHRQREVFNFIVERIGENGSPPTYREIMVRFDFTSPNGVTFHLRALERKGLIYPAIGTPRGVVVAGVKWVPVSIQPDDEESASGTLSGELPESI